MRINSSINIKLDVETAAIVCVALVSYAETARVNNCVEQANIATRLADSIARNLYNTNEEE